MSTNNCNSTTDNICNNDNILPTPTTPTNINININSITGANTIRNKRKKTSHETSSDEVTADSSREDVVDSWENVILFENISSKKVAQYNHGKSRELLCVCTNCDDRYLKLEKYDARKLDQIVDHIFEHYVEFIPVEFKDDTARHNAFKGSLTNFCKYVYRSKATVEMRKRSLEGLQASYRATFTADDVAPAAPSTPPPAADPFMLNEDDDGDVNVNVRALILDPENDKETIDNEQKRVHSGRIHLEQTKLEFNNAHLELAPAEDSLMKQIEGLLNKGKMSREDVSSKVDDVFEFTRCVNEDGDRLGGIDIYTGWSKEDFDNILNVREIDQLEPLFKQKENKSSFYEVDHIWEIQLVNLAIRELMRFQGAKVKKGGNKEIRKKYQIGLVELNYISKIINSLANLNCTPWKVNNYKGKLLKNFRGTYQITDNAMNYSVRSHLIGNRTFTFLMKKFPTYQDMQQKARTLIMGIKDETTEDDKVKLKGSAGGAADAVAQHKIQNETPHAGELNQDEDPFNSIASKQPIIDNVQNAMRNVLTSLFYDKFFNIKPISEDEDEDKYDIESRLMNREALQLLYGIFCHMYTTMFPGF